jgi:hypothetical protein
LTLNRHHIHTTFWKELDCIHNCKLESEWKSKEGKKKDASLNQNQKLNFSMTKYKESRVKWFSKKTTIKGPEKLTNQKIKSLMLATFTG